MQFNVPQFIEREPKIWLNMTFSQFLFIGGGGVICLLFYFSFAKTHFLIFLLIAAVIMSLASAFAFLKVGGRSLATILKNFFFFSLAPKIYLWHRKNVLPKIVSNAGKEKTADGPDDSSGLKLSGKSQLRNLSNSIETKK